MSPFETPSLHFEAIWLLCFQAPEEDVERVMAAVLSITPLALGAYDGNAWQSAPGIERYRPREGAVAGAESALRRRPGVVEMSFQLPRDEAILERVVETIYETHSYQEPVILLRETLASRTKGRDDRDNPNRWWNTVGDWKTAAEA